MERREGDTEKERYTERDREIEGERNEREREKERYIDIYRERYG